MTTTRAYKAQQEFDSLVIGEPEFSLGYDQTMGLDFSWRTMHFDKYNNIVYIETLSLDEKGNEKISSHTSQIYFSPREKKLDRVIEKMDFGGTNIKEYIRNQQGQLIELREFYNNELTQKTIYHHNSYGQRIKEETFGKNGLLKTISYFFNSPQDSSQYYAKSIFETVSENNKLSQETYYERDENYQLRKESFKSFTNNQLMTNLVYSYLDYNNGKATKIITEGFNKLSPTEEADTFQGIMHKTFNNIGDIIDFNYSTNSLNKRKSNNLLDDLVLRQNYRCQYTYNDKNDWIKIILTTKILQTDQYIITREIKYLK